MATERLLLTGTDRWRYFAPVIFCGLLVLVCAALIATSFFLQNLPDAVAVTMAGIFGLVLCLALGALLLTSQLRELRYVKIETRFDADANFAVVAALATELGWTITYADVGRRLDARTPGQILNAGEIVAARFNQGEVRVASICDPGIGFSLVGRRRSHGHREAVRQALLRAF